MPGPINLPLSDTADANGNATLTVSLTPGEWAVFNVFGSVPGTGAQSTTVQASGLQGVQGFGQAPQLGPISAAPNDQVQIVIAGATPGATVQMLVQGESHPDYSQLPQISSPAGSNVSIVGGSVTLSGPVTISGPVTVDQPNPASLLTGGVGVLNQQVVPVVKAPSPGTPGSAFSAAIPLAGFGASSVVLSLQGFTFPANSVVFNVQWYDVSNAFLGQQTYEISQNVSQAISVPPNIGDHMVVQVQNYDTANPINALIQVVPFIQEPARRWTQGDGSLIDFAGQSIGAGNAVEIFGGFVFDGPAVLNFLTGSSTYVAFMRVWILGSPHAIWESTNANIANGLVLNTTLPRRPISLRFTNNGASAVAPIFNLQAGE